MIIDMFKRSGKKREKEKWASSSETAFPFEKGPLLAGRFCPFSLPPPPLTPFPSRFPLRPPHLLAPVVKKVDDAVH